MEPDLPRPPLQPPGSAALFLDFDGTLVELATTPSGVTPAPALPQLLARLERRLGGALAIVSGRPIEEIDHFLSPLQLTVAGLHGMDSRLADGTRRRMPAAASALSVARGRLERFVRAWPGTLIEDKGLTLALHYRNVPEAEPAALLVASACVRATDGALGVRPGKMVLELAPPGRTKGDAIADLLAQAPFAGRAPVFVGDDVTDEDGFRAVNRLGGLSVKVAGAGVATAAMTRLPDVAAVLAWLEAIAGASPRGAAGQREE